MGKLAFVQTAPKSRTWKIEIDGRTVEDEQEMLDWVRNSCKGHVSYYRTDFQMPKAVTQAKWGQQLKFRRNGYWVYTFWFEKKKDATLFKLFWMNQ